MAKKAGNLLAVVCILMYLFCLSACGIIEDMNEELYYCESCGKEVKQAVEAEGGSGYYCYACAIESEYIKCHECGGYYENDWFDCNDAYCHYCFERSGERCYVCGQSMGKLAAITVGGEEYYVCPDCTTDYFASIEPMEPVSYCLECREMFVVGTDYYEHYLFHALICPECLVENGYEKCTQCGKYTSRYGKFESEELVDGLCGLCAEKGANGTE